MFHGGPISIISNHGTPFSSHFRKSFYKGLGTKLCFSIAFHPQTDEQADRAIQTSEDMVCACVTDYGGSLYDHFPLIEFAYKNNFYSSIGMVPIEELYGRRYHSPI